MTARRHMLLSLTAATLGLAVLVSVCVGGAAWRLTTGDSSDASCDTAPIRFTLKAPRLDALTLDGDPWSLDRLRGKVVLVHFWATWCAPCLDQVPTIRALQDRFGERGDFKIVNVGIASSPGDLRATAARHRIPGEVVWFPDKIDTLPPGFRVWGLPTTWLISRTGRMGPAPLEKEGVPDLIAGVIASGE
jgi:thiol-disulfide isomerase/thioredoxin